MRNVHPRWLSLLPTEMSVNGQKFCILFQNKLKFDHDDDMFINFNRHIKYPQISSNQITRYLRRRIIFT